jgi:hypothetical protein
MKAFTFFELLQMSQADHAVRATIPREAEPVMGSKLASWGSRHAALRAAISMIQEEPGTIQITKNCPELEKV